MRTLIKAGTICLAEEVFKGDLLICDEKIEQISMDYQGDYDHIIDASDKFVCPGGVDAHTHMALQQSPKYRAVDDFYTGGIAAACGGTTTIIDHMGFGEKDCTLFSRFEEYTDKAKDCPIDYSFHGVFQHIDEDILKELKDIIINKGFSSFKAYTTYGYPMFDKELMQILHVMKETNGLLCVHAENDAMTNILKERYAKEGGVSAIYQAYSRPNVAEAEAVSRLIYLAGLENDSNLYIVHLSAKESLDEVCKARRNGQKNIFVETCTQYLTLTEDKFKEEDGIKYIMAPPLRKEEDLKRLWKGVALGEIQVIATDHCPFTIEEKLAHKDDYRFCPGGVSGVEERMPIIFSEGVLKNRISLQKFVEVTASNPAKIFGLGSQKGSILPGFDADVIIIDPNRSRVFEKGNLKTKAAYSGYEGMKVNCVIDTVFCRGKMIARDNEFLGHKGYGRLLYRFGKIE